MPTTHRRRRRRSRTSGRGWPSRVNESARDPRRSGHGGARRASYSLCLDGFRSTARHGDLDLRAATALGAKLQGATDLFDAFGHADEPESTPCGVEVESDTIVADSH